MAQKRMEQSYKIKIFLIILLTVALLASVWIGFYYAVNDHKKNLEDSYSASELSASTQLSGELRSEMELRMRSGGSQEDAEKAAIENVMEKQDVSASRYAFFYSSDGVLFERNDTETANYAGISLKSLFDKWRFAGGSGFDSAQDMMLSHSSGTDIYVRSAGTGEEIVAWSCFTERGKTYIAGLSTTVSFLMQAEKVGEHIVWMGICAGVLTLALLIVALILCIQIFLSAHQMAQLSADLAKKNILVTDMTTRLEMNAADIEKASIYDTLTGLYNRYYFDVLFPKLDAELFLPVSVLLLNINGLGQINEEKGYQMGDYCLKAVSKVILSNCRDTDIAARLGNDTFCLIMINTTESEAYKIVDLIREDESMVRLMIELSYGISVKQGTDILLADVLSAAEKNMNIEKLTEKSSARYNAVRLLRESIVNSGIETDESLEKMKASAMKTGKALNLSHMELIKLESAAILHDIGKISIPDSILKKQAPLTETESQLIRKHCEIGSKMASVSPDLNEISGYILQHHEWFNGGGYPQGLAGNNIELLSRIIAVADSYVSMTSPRAYRPARSSAEAVDELLNCCGTQFDPAVVHAFINAQAWM